MEALAQTTIRTVAVIAEGVPEKDTKVMIAYARTHNKVLLGPATVGGVQVSNGGMVEGCVEGGIQREGRVVWCRGGVWCGRPGVW